MRGQPVLQLGRAPQPRLHQLPGVAQLQLRLGQTIGDCGRKKTEQPVDVPVSSNNSELTLGFTFIYFLFFGGGEYLNLGTCLTLFLVSTKNRSCLREVPAIRPQQCLALSDHTGPRRPGEA